MAGVFSKEHVIFIIAPDVIFKKRHIPNVVLKYFTNYDW